MPQFLVAVVCWLILQNDTTLLLNRLNYGKYHSLLGLFPHVRVQLSLRWFVFLRFIKSLWLFVLFFLLIPIIENFIWRMFFNGASMACKALFLSSRWKESGSKLQSPTCLPYLQFYLISKPHYWTSLIYLKNSDFFVQYFKYDRLFRCWVSSL